MALNQSSYWEIADFQAEFASLGNDGHSTAPRATNVTGLSAGVSRETINDVRNWRSDLEQGHAADDSAGFQKVALQRLTAAEQIMGILRLSLEAQYIGGYSVECSLKALILEKTAENDRPDILDRLTHDETYHRAEVLLDRLRDRGVFLTVELAKRMRRFDWTTGLRYETGRKDTGETNGLLRTARAIYEWVEEQIQ